MSIGAPEDFKVVNKVMWGAVQEPTNKDVESIEQMVLKYPHVVYELLQQRARHMKYILMVGAMDQTKEQNRD